MRLFQGCFFIITLVFRRKCGCFIIWHRWFDWYLSSSWIRWVTRQCFQRVIWGQGMRQNYNSIMCRTDTLSFPHCIIMTECVFQLFPSLVYQLHHISKWRMLVFVRVKLTSQGTIWFFISSSVEDSFKPRTKNLIHQPPNPESTEELFEWIIHSVPVWRMSDWECELHVYLLLDEFFQEIWDLHTLFIFIW